MADSTIRTYRSVLRVIMQSHPNFEFYDRWQLIGVMADIKDPIYRNSIRNVILKVHKDMLNKDVDIPLIKKPQRLTNVYTLDEVKKIFSQIKNAKHLAIAYLLYVEGMRVGEVVSILKDDCSKQDKIILIRNTKNKSDYIKYIDDSTIAVLESYCEWLRVRRWGLKKYLFENRQGYAYSKRSIQQFMKKAIIDSGLKVYGSCHVFRRSNAVWKIENGWSPKHIAASLNNSEKTVNKYYALVRPDYLKTLPKPAF